MCRRLREAARDGVDVRLLVPGSSDVQILQPIVRAGYRPLIEAGIRVFEWNGPMLHAKTAVADGRWSRVGSTNLNIASWAMNWELDVVVEDAEFGAAMEEMFLQDLGNATEIVPGASEAKKPGIARVRPRRVAGRIRSRTSRVGRLAAGAIALGNTVGTAIAGSRSLNVTEARSIATIGLLLLSAAAMISAFPILIVAPLVITLVWFGAAFLVRAFRLRGRNREESRRPRPPPGSGARNSRP